MTFRRLATRLFGLGVFTGALVLSGCLSSSDDSPDGATGVDISGTVLGVGERPTAGVEIHITEVDAEAKTGPDGSFTFRDLPWARLEFTVRTGRTSTFRVNPLMAGGRSEMTIRLDENGEVESVLVLRGDGGGEHAEAIHRLVRPEGAPDEDARGKVEIERKGNGEEEFEIEIEKLDQGAVFDILLEDPEDSILKSIGEITIDHGDEGELEFETHHGDDLPFDVMSLEDLFGMRVEIRGQGDGLLYLEGTVPSELLPGDEKQKGENRLTRVAGPPDGEGKVKIRSKPRKHDERFEVKLEHMDPFTAYQVCIQCASGSPPSVRSARRAAPAPPAAPGAGPGTLRIAQATLSLPDISADPGTAVQFPITLSTPLDVVFAQIVVEYKSAHLTFVDAILGADAAAGGLTGFEVNTDLPFSTTSTGLDANVLVQLSPPDGTGSVTGVGQELALLQFQVVGPAGASSALNFDFSEEVGQLHSFLTLMDGTELADPTAVALDNGSITILGSPSGGDFTCFGLLETDEEGEGKLKLKTKNGDMLPCGVEYVADIQGDSLQVRDLGDVVLFRGRVPFFGEDDD